MTQAINLRIEASLTGSSSSAKREKLKIATLGDLAKSVSKKECPDQDCLYQCDYEDPSSEALSSKVIKIGDYLRPILNPNGAMGGMIVVAFSVDDFKHEVGIGVSSHDSVPLNCSILLSAAREFLNYKYNRGFKKTEALAAKVFKKMLSESLIATKVCHIDLDDTGETLQWEIYLPGEYKGSVPKQFGKSDELRGQAFAVFRTSNGNIDNAVVPLPKVTDLSSCHNVALRAFLRLREIERTDSQLELFLLV